MLLHYNKHLARHFPQGLRLCSRPVPFVNVFVYLSRFALTNAGRCISPLMRCLVPAYVHVLAEELWRRLLKVKKKKRKDRSAHLWLSLVTLFSRALFTVPLVSPASRRALQLLAFLRHIEARCHDVWTLWRQRRK
uniref:Uncharacterized protein n=1 Tax=Rhipicephalus zambeziensis TaxID=60191 RepID=A0A224Y7E2_9ACAR